MKPDVSVIGLDKIVRENTEVVVACKVSRVKPAADIYWRKGPDGSLQTGTTSSGLNQDGKTFHLQSFYITSFSRSEHNTKLYCLVTRPGDSTDIWATASQTVSVGCEYQWTNTLREMSVLQFARQIHRCRRHFPEIITHDFCCTENVYAANLRTNCKEHVMVISN